VCRESDAPSVKARIPKLNALGLSVDWIDALELRALEPNLAHDYAGAARLNDMGQVSPMRLVVEMARRAAARGATILTNTNVIGIEASGGRVTAVRTQSGRIATGEVIIAAGAWSRDIARLAELSVPVWPLKGHVMVTEPLPGLLRHYLTEAEYEIAAASFAETVMTADGPTPGAPRTAAVLQPLPSGQILVGSSREFAEDREVNRERIAQIARRATRVLPALAQRRIIRTYAGLRPWTPDGRPLIGRTSLLNGITLAAGHGGEGNTRSLVTGRIVADLLAGVAAHIDIRPLSPDRFDLRMPASAA
jgi:sarcosine oxidase subunit beta